MSSVYGFNTNGLNYRYLRHSSAKRNVAERRRSKYRKNILTSVWFNFENAFLTENARVVLDA